MSSRASHRSRRPFRCARKPHSLFTCPSYKPKRPEHGSTQLSRPTLTSTPPSTSSSTQSSTQSSTPSSTPLTQTQIQTIRNSSSFTPPITMPGSLLIRGLSGVLTSAVETVANVLIAFDAANTPNLPPHTLGSGKSFSNSPTSRRKRSRCTQNSGRNSASVVARNQRSSSISPPTKRSHRRSSQSPSPNSSISDRYTLQKQTVPLRSIYIPSRTAQASLISQKSDPSANHSLVTHRHIRRPRRVRFASFVETLC